MVVLFSEKNSRQESEIIEILTKNGGDYISGKKIISTEGLFTMTSKHKCTSLEMQKGIAVFLEAAGNFDGQVIPGGLTGICEEKNEVALTIFKDNFVPVISFGMSPTNTITISSCNEATVLVSIQRTLIGFDGSIIEPAEYKISLTKDYSFSAIMISFALLIMHGRIPVRF